MNQFFTWLGSPHGGQQKLFLAPLVEELAAQKIIEGIDPQPSHLLYVTLWSDKFGVYCLSVYLYSL
jgi:hypothetical protein